jgi:hypothetical protein
MMVINSKYNFFELVYLKTDCDQRQRMVTRLNVNPNGITYELTCGTQTSWHYEEEIAEEKDVLITSSSS